ncbi:class I SAM-dependent methyltransferase [Bacillus sp. B1-b2]|uniref:class I SAM-dependent methyltransferase n=1 Tax=Bacillus sp. B1-b2 TaxID=2653201 RepID=UPI0012625919|nr:class I SAM-dependent methyltransferase [Bacillus sp. B1-b2]KAB7672474.1 class I SAM-dependent methyltransferase [Bacillus sp. B1-b2]
MHFDHFFQIETEKIQLGFNKSYEYHRYEPTPYEYLEKLIHAVPLQPSDYVVDFGCGKGRLNFFLHHFTKASVTGIELNEDFYLQALQNLEQYAKRHGKCREKIHFYHGKAEEYTIKQQDNYFYFFNPFSIHIFRKILDNVLLSLDQKQRLITIVLYFPSEEYQYLMNNHSLFQKVGELEFGSKDQFLIYQNRFV